MHIYRNGVRPGANEKFVDTKSAFHYPCAAKNITITLPKNVVPWLRVQAAESGRSVSRWLAHLLEETKRQDDDYDIEMKRYLALKPEKLNENGAPCPPRDSHYDRPGVR
ncbi:MAG: hypothetical protein OXE03_02550 [Gammaproteobacteria bacterium]|nr:hypothetical protein [Gammaproteobacteria bacterium]